MPFKFIPQIWHGAHDCPICHKKDGLWSKVSKSKLYWLYVCENCGTKLLIPKNQASLPPGVTTKTGAAPLSPPLMYKGGTRQPMRGKRQRRVARTALGSEHLDIAAKDPSPMHQMAKREYHPMPSNTPSYHDSLRQPLLCPDDCPSKRFCDPSSCALESVREANAIAVRLRRAE